MTHARPCHFLCFSAVRLGICEVSVVWGTSDFQGLFRGSQICAFLLPRFCSGFSGSGVRAEGVGGEKGSCRSVASAVTSQVKVL